jgi:Cu-processing system permease protein
MNHPILILMNETFLLLRRDKIFLPVLVSGFLITLLANLASDWSIEDFSKILFDVGIFGFQFTGSFVAIFWGSKLIHDSKQDGSVELSLAAPVSRSSWIIGRYLGLSISLALMTFIFLVFWQFFMALNDFGMMSAQHYTIFGFMYLGWLVIAAMSMFFASFCGTGVALFSSMSLWFAGLVTNLVYQNLSPTTAPHIKTVVNTLARIWDLQQFNLINEIYTRDIMVASELGYRLLYGIGLISVLITMTSIWFTKRDIT